MLKCTLMFASVAPGELFAISEARRYRILQRWLPMRWLTLAAWQLPQTDDRLSAESNCVL